MQRYIRDYTAVAFNIRTTYDEIILTIKNSTIREIGFEFVRRAVYCVYNVDVHKWAYMHMKYIQYAFQHPAYEHEHIKEKSSKNRQKEFY